MLTTFDKANVTILANALTMILVWVLNKYFDAGIETVIQGAINTVVSYAFVFLTPNKEV